MAQKQMKKTLKQRIVPAVMTGLFAYIVLGYASNFYSGSECVRVIANAQTRSVDIQSRAVPFVIDINWSSGKGNLGMKGGTRRCYCFFGYIIGTRTLGDWIS